MKVLQQSEHAWLRFGLVFVWLYTALVSYLELDGRSAKLFDGTTLEGSHLIPALIWAGIVADVVLGLALWLYPRRGVYLTALAGMLVMTVLATLLIPTLWLDPLGSLTKNIPIAIVLVVLARSKA